MRNPQVLTVLLQLPYNASYKLGSQSTFFLHTPLLIRRGKPTLLFCRLECVCTTQEHELKTLSDKLIDLNSVKETVKVSLYNPSKNIWANVVTNFVLCLNKAMSFEASLMLMTDALFAETQISFECLFSICLTTTILNNMELDHIFCLI